MLLPNLLQYLLFQRAGYRFFHSLLGLFFIIKFFSNRYQVKLFGMVERASFLSGFSLWLYMSLFPRADRLFCLLLFLYFFFFSFYLYFLEKGFPERYRFCFFLCFFFFLYFP